MIATLELANTCITSHNYHFSFVARTIKTKSLRNFVVYITVVVCNHCVCIRLPELMYLSVASFLPLNNISPIPSFPQTLVASSLLCFYKFSFLDFTYK